MSEAEAAAQAQLGAIKRELETIRFRLLGVHATLPAAPAEVVPLMEVPEEMMRSTHLRAVIETLLVDKIEPAIRDLRDVSTLSEKT